MFKLTSYLKKYKNRVILGPLFKFFEAFFDLVTPILVALILDRGIPNDDKKFIAIISIIIIAMNILGFGCAIICSKCASKVSRGVGLDIRRDMYKKITELSSNEKDRYTTMALTNRVVHDVNQIEVAIGMTIRQVARSPFLLVGSTVAAIIIDAKLSLIFIAVIPLILLIVFTIMKKAGPKYIEAKFNLDRVSNVTREMLSGSRVVRAFNKQEYENKKFAKANENYTSTNLKIGALSAIMQPLLFLVVNLGIIAVVYFGGLRVNVGSMSQGKIISFINYFSQISASLVVIARLIIIYTRTGASIKRVNEIYEIESSIKSPKKNNLLTLETPANLEFKNVCFSYNNQKNNINNLSIFIPGGSTVGVIGGTGSGKSTLVNLLPRFYDVTSGEILIDGKNIKTFDLKDLRNFVSIVPQNPTLFKGTIESNLKFRNENATLEEMTKALKISQSYEFVMEKPDGIKTRVVRGGKNFSGGQKQRLTIARALIGNPKIVILDDSSSALDYETDYNLRSALKNTLNGSTKIIVSQRVNSIKNADLIIVLDNGNVCGIGTHDELLKGCQTYLEIYDSQNQKGGEWYMTKKLASKDPVEYESPIVSEASAIINSKKKRSLKQTLAIGKRIIVFGKPFHGYLYIALIAILIQTVFELLAPVFLGRAIDYIISAGNVNFDGLIKNVANVAICVGINVLFTWVANFYTNKYCFKSSEHMRKIIFKKFNSVPLKYLDENAHGDLLSRMINDVELLTDGYLEGLSSITNGIVTIIATLIFMFILNIPLAMVVLFLTPMSLVISFYIAKKSYKLFAEQARCEGELNGYLEEMISGDKLVTAFNYEQQAQDGFEKINQRFYKVSERAEFYSNLTNPATRFINGLVYIMVAFIGAYLAIKGNITVGLISSFLSYANSFGKPFNELSTEVTELQAAFASSDRIFAILDAKDEPSDDGLPELASTDGIIEIKDVDFSYHSKQRLIQDFNLNVNPGETIAIVGPTGCGKTTLINLLMRFYDVTNGAIYLDGNNITQIKRNSLRNKYGMVLQETWIFSGTIKENIAYGKPNATDDEIKNAALAVGADEFIEKMANGYNTVINEDGSNLSAGQKQLICIARVMLIKPPMLILDEATSNIDTRTELKIQHAFDNLMLGRTTFIVAHRLSTIKNADKILVMNKGNIVEQGNHDELIEKHGFYYHLYNSQFSKV